MTLGIWNAPANNRTNEGRIARRRRQPNSQPPTAVSQTTSELKFRKSQTTSELVKSRQSQNSKKKSELLSNKVKIVKQLLN